VVSICSRLDNLANPIIFICCPQVLNIPGNIAVRPWVKDGTTPKFHFALVLTMGKFMERGNEPKTFVLVLLNLVRLLKSTCKQNLQSHTRASFST
jgi:hypothetical protein